MAKCMVCEKDTVVFQYVRFTEAGEDPRVLFCRFDQLLHAKDHLPEDFKEPFTLRWNPGPTSDKLGLDEHRRLASDPRMRALPNMVRVTIKRSDMRTKLSQFVEARGRLLNP